MTEANAARRAPRRAIPRYGERYASDVVWADLEAAKATILALEAEVTALKHAFGRRVATANELANEVDKLEDDKAALVEKLGKLLASCGARGRYNALEYTDAVEAAEATLAKHGGDK